MPLHILTREEKTALRQFYMPPYPEGWVGMYVSHAQLRGGTPLRVLNRVGLIAPVDSDAVGGWHFRLTILGIRARRMMETRTNIAVEDALRVSDPAEIITHDYLDNIESAEEPEFTELEREILQAFQPGTGGNPGFFYRLLHAEYENASDAIVSLTGQGYIEYEGESMDFGIYRLTAPGYQARRRATGDSDIVEETPLPPPIQAGQRRLRNRNKK